MTNAKSIYVVDDDDAIRTLLKTYLEKQQFQVFTAESGETFLADFPQHSHVDLVVLDIMLPGQDGFSVCRSLRALSHVPVIMLTANSDEMDRIIGLEMGADDYLAKPFNPRELLARIKAILRRMEHVDVIEQDHIAQRYFHFASFSLDTLSRELSFQGEKESLSGADYNLLMLFLAHPGEVLSREQIAENTRGRESAPLDRFIDVHISRLRQRLREDARHPQLIKTVRGQGYILTANVLSTDSESNHFSSMALSDNND
ncbi:Transcriptional regulatory protein OmpR [Marinomonas spartinae]|uniref:Transcriptional regulatory protein OmpR n=1 Tax=Marinomonas spartinae TaxID=1792290 RepID=A0A1A8SZN5_9GAMM|nr:response regulator transcription factor [Marinomonas spartinae]SBS24669.1 Transcriptional regulatory protein OmpR [Marinomonas spartinae]SBS25525.1 Transcriptional regulatory protein OmpR [Marinomonas spartinae]